MKKEDILKLNNRELTLLIYQRLRDKIITQEQANQIIEYWRQNGKVQDKYTDLEEQSSRNSGE